MKTKQELLKEILKEEKDAIQRKRGKNQTSIAIVIVILMGVIVSIFTSPHYTDDYFSLIVIVICVLLAFFCIQSMPWGKPSEVRIKSNVKGRILKEIDDLPKGIKELEENLQETKHRLILMQELSQGN